MENKQSEQSHSDVFNKSTKYKGVYQQSHSDSFNKSTSKQGELEQQLRNKWVIGSKCMIFSRTFKQWIYTTIEKIENKDHQEILTVKNYGDKHETISFNRYSNNIQ
eukprot:283167_1